MFSMFICKSWFIAIDTHGSLVWEGGCLKAQFGNFFPYTDPPWTVSINTWKGRHNQDKHNE